MEVGDRVAWIDNGMLMRGTILKVEKVKDNKFPSENYLIKNQYHEEVWRRGWRLIPSPIAKIEELYKGVMFLTIDPASLHSREIMGEQQAYEKVLKILKEGEK